MQRWQEKCVSSHLHFLEFTEAFSLQLVCNWKKLLPKICHIRIFNRQPLPHVDSTNNVGPVGKRRGSLLNFFKNSEVVTLLPFNFVEAALPPSVDHLVGLWCI